MTGKFSVVIICKNEEAIIDRVLNAVKDISDDVLLYDTGSTDGTIDKIRNAGVRLHQGVWMGYGKTKQAAVQLANHDWVLSIDADEIPDDTLRHELQNLSLADEKKVYQMWFRNFLGEKYLKYGEWGKDKHVRLFNRRVINWNDAAIHEQLIIPGDVKAVTLNGYILHHTVADLKEYSNKVMQYALLNAEKYYRQGKRATWIKLYINPLFSFIKHFIFQLGFLDGWLGLVSAYMTSFYTFLKYARLRELHQRR